MQECQLFRCQLDIEEIDTCQISAGPGKAGDKTLLDWIFGSGEYDGYRRGRCLGRECSSGTSAGGNHRDLSAN
jgi:hypothetical protein